ncbi:MAG: YlmC/YmxH family sporulation protein [Clostridia bacterium]|nr:YlmC/YmxH family sporulation protein [Clostridia bacterium]
METTFTELRNKEVINVLTGRLLGNVCDLVLDLRRNIILGLVVPGSKSIFNFFKCCQEIFIPYSSICKIGEDVILVEVLENSTKKKRKNVKVFDMGENEKITQEEICAEKNNIESTYKNYHNCQN